MSAAAARRPRGRRPAGADTRGAILSAARAEFADRGYDATAIREVARRAGVDAALVHHYFDGKPALFVAALELPVNPHERLVEVVAGGPGGIGERLVGAFLSVWEPAAGRERILALLRSAVTHDEAARLLREFLLHEVARPLARATGEDDIELRASLVVAQLVGLAMARYVVRVEPLASAPAALVVTHVGAAVQGYLTALAPPSSMA